MKKIVLLALATLITACGGDVTGPSEPSSPPPEELKSLQGSWDINCEADEDNESINGETAFSNSGVSARYDYYDDANCSLESLSIKFKGTIFYAGEKTSSNGLSVKKIDTKIDTNTILIALHNSDLLSRYNTNSVCGRNNWSRGDFVNISSCADLSDTVDLFKDTQKDIYYIDGKEVYWGDEESTIDEDDYPNDLEIMPSWTKS